MPSNTVFNPQNLTDFEKSKLNKDAKGVAATMTAGQSTSLDLTITDDVLMAGGTSVLVRGAAQGDKMDFQVVHPVAGVLVQFVTDWYVNPDSTLQQTPPSNYPAKLLTGLILRIIYHSVGETDVWLAVNYNREKVLV
jgi:hypothetical protein